MVFLSSDPLTNPFSAEVAYLTVLHEIVDSLRDHAVGRQRSRTYDGMKRKGRRKYCNSETNEIREGA